MARVALPVQEVNRTGVEPSATAITTDGASFINKNGTRFVLLANASGSTAAITVVTGTTLDGLAVSDLSISLPDGDSVMLGPFPEQTYNQTDGSGQVWINTDQALTGSCFYLTTAGIS